MKILVLGSINIDYNYYVGHITTPKETQGASHMEVFPGGKGLNQAVTLARAGLEVQLAGQIAAIAAHTVNVVPRGFTAQSPIRKKPPKRRGHLRESYKTKL